MTLQVIIQNLLGTIINPLIPVVFGLALIAFFWGLARYLFSGLGEKDLQGAKNLMLWGVIALTVMLSIWGVVSLIQNIFLNGAPPNTPPTIPQF